ncbi:MAG: bifunctional UDP-N-acetylglucosamine diphosphorylase/glucosamine-1-phosphate N-acetyltransferase GlmU [Pseudomonadota bacterium]
MSEPLSIIILAAGEGSRMHSRVPKVLHPVGPCSMLAHVVTTARSLDPTAIHVVHGHSGETVRAAMADVDAADSPALTWVRQEEQLGTAHAVAQALPLVPDEHRVLVLYGDVPLVTCETLARLDNAAANSGLAILTAHMTDPAGYGRILRDDSGYVAAIVEERDATDTQRAIHETNTGMLGARARELKDWLARIGNDNAQGEYYLTDSVALAVADGFAPAAVVTPDHREASGVNNRVQLAETEGIWRQRQAEALMLAGVTLRDPARVDVRGEVECGCDVVLDVGVVIEGRVELGDGVHVGPYTVLRDCRLSAGTVVEGHCVIEGATTGGGASVGPFARLRPGASLDESAKVGNFVEVKASHIGRGSKVNHLAYIGDTRMGQDVNIGAGTITCNYDGANKHATTIGDDVFVGSDCQLVAPVDIGDGATIGAGTTLTRDAPAGQLTLSRTKARTLADWKRPEKTGGNGKGD